LPDHVFFSEIAALRVFVFLLIAYTILLVASEFVRISDDLFYDFLNRSLSHERINRLLEESKDWKWVTYLFFPSLLIIKFFMVATCFSTGTLVLGIESSFKKLFQSAINVEFIFLVPPIIKLFWFSLYRTDFTLDDLQYFSPLSVFSLFNPTQVEPFLV